MLHGGSGSGMSEKKAHQVSRAILYGSMFGQYFVKLILWRTCKPGARLQIDFHLGAWYTWKVWNGSCTTGPPPSTPSWIG